jgi:CheY-like chemotaxis protein
MTRTWNGNELQARILVVDDNRTIALTLGAILQEHGYETATAFSGAEAIAKAAGFLPDLLVSDVCMGAMNGIEAASRITARLPGCKVLFLSGQASMSDVLNAAPERLVYSFISKPIHPLDLLNAIAYMLPAANPREDAVAMVMEQEAIERYSLARMRVLAGFILSESRTGAQAAAQGKPGAAFVNFGPPAAAGVAMRLQ